MKKCIILGNGKAPARNLIPYLKKNGYDFLICADGGANSALKLNLIPDVIIGDLDSISKEALSYFKSKSIIKKISRQNDTDIEKCLKFAIKNGYKDIILTGVTGKRLDHTFCNLGIVLKFFKLTGIKIIAEDSILVPYQGKVTIPAIKGETISLYGFNSITRINSSGLRYPLKNVSLPFGEKESTSNLATKDNVLLEITGGIIFVIRDFKLIKKYDLLKFI